MSQSIPVIPKSDDWILDDEGEVILVVGKPEPCRIRVSPKVLSLASDVFKAMFSPRFREGSSLRTAENSTAEPVIITLPEDDQAAMLSLCQLLHYQIDIMDIHPDLKMLLALATICDKYNCVCAVRCAAHIWLIPLVDSADPESLNDLLVTSYLFGCSELFTQVTYKLLKAWNGSIKKLVRDQREIAVPASVYGEPHINCQPRSPNANAS